VGITLSGPQAHYATLRARFEGTADLVEFLVQDYRDVEVGPFAVVSSIRMSDHLGRRSLDKYSQEIYGDLRPGGRLLNHAIDRSVPFAWDEPPSRLAARARQVRVALAPRGPSKIYSPFTESYVFPHVAPVDRQPHKAL
jgi:cyclopropane fatty-acyl-phospholipid synthase-like methyltransferase